MKRILLAAAIMGLVTAACGGGGNDHEGMNTMNTEGSTATSGVTAAATRTVEVTMVDIAYQPTTLNVQRGERIEFVFQNKGAIAHDAFIGDTAAQAEHEKDMREGGSKGGHDKMGGEGNAITVEPGKTGRLAYTFDKPGAIEIACHEPGHYAAGMKIAVTVT